MKTKIFRISKQTLSIVLALMMIISTMLVGTITTVNAVSETFTANQTLYIDIGDQWETLYEDGTSIPYIRFSYSAEDNDVYNNCISRVKLESSDNVTGSIYKVTVPNNYYCRAIVLERCDSSNTDTVWDTVKTTASERSSDSDNCFTIKNWHDTVGWSTYTEGGSSEEDSEIITNDDEYIVYYDNSTTKWSTVNAYAWNNDSDNNAAWSGQSMTLLSGNIYYLVLSKAYSKVIFNDGSNQTGDLTLGTTNINKMYNSSGWVDPPYYTVTATAKFGDTTLEGVSNLLHSQYTTAKIACLHTLDLTASATVTVDGTEYKFKEWSVATGAGTLDDATSAETTFTPTKHSTLIAVYELAGNAITCSTDGNGTLTSNKPYVPEGEPVTLTATANLGYKLSKLTVNGNTVEAEQSTNESGQLKYTYSFNMGSSDVAANASFEKIDYNITYDDLYSDIVTYKSDNPTTAHYGDSVTVSFTVIDGYECTSVTGGNNGTLSDTYKYTFTMPAGDVFISPVVNAKQITAPTVKINGSTSATSTTYMDKAVDFTTSYSSSLSYAEYASHEFVVTKDGATVSDVTNYIKGDSTNGYTFTASEIGEYEITYKVTFKNRYDSTKTATDTATLTVTVGYTDLQQDYVDLRDYASTLTAANESEYSSGVAEFNRALAAAQEAVSAGLPATDATTSGYDYATLLTNLKIAEEGLVPAYDYYIGGRFQVRVDGEIFNTDPNGSSEWHEHPNTDEFKFTKVDGKSYYKLNTGLTLTEIGDITDEPYFIVYSKKSDSDGSSSNHYHNYGTKGKNTNLDSKIDTKIQLEELETTDDSQLCFSSSVSGDDYITFYFDPSTLEFWFEASPKYSLTTEVTNPDYGSVSPTEGTYAEGQSVTLASNGKTVDGVDYVISKVILVGETSGTSTTVFDLESTGASNDDFSVAFSMPDKNVTAKVTFGEKPSYTVDYSCDPSKGSITATYDDTTVSGNTVKISQGDSITLTANAATGYKLSTWTFSNNNYTLGSEETASSTTITLTPGESIVVEATFVTDPGTATSDHKLLYNENKDTLLNPSNTGNGVDVQLYSQKYTPSGKSKSYDSYYATISSTDIGMEEYESHHNYYFGITSTSSTSPTKLYGTSNNSNASGPSVVVLTPDTISSTSTKIEDRGETYNNTYYKMFCVNLYMTDASTTDEITIRYVPDLNTYYVSATAKVADNTIKVYGKDGTAKGSGSTSDFGDTTITGDANGTCTSHSDYVTYYAVEGEKITAQTVVNETYANYGYYVAAYVINGVKYDVVSTDTNTFQLATPYTMGTDSIEITPVYYNSNIERDNDYITIYVDASTLGNHWGNTISIYSYYYNTSEGTTKGDGSYPGQPLMLDPSGYYVGKISKHAYINGKQQSQTISGITLNNYYEGETVHQNFLPSDSKKNLQTYDYDDFKWIAEMECDTLRFDIKYETDKPTNQETLVNNDYGNGSSSGYPSVSSSFSIDTYGTYSDGKVTGSAPNGWEYLTDFDGNLASILGYTDDTLPSSAGVTKLDRDNPLRIVSVGNQYTAMGEWSTLWYVYDSNDKLIAKGLPSDFIPRVSSTERDDNGYPKELALASQTSAYQAIVNNELQYKTAFITYETEQNADTSHKSNSGTRLDGRWYYARSVAQVKVETGIIYADSEDSTEWTEDTYTTDTITGTVTKADVSVNGVTSLSVDRNTVVTVSATHGKSYKFVGWATKNEDGTSYTKSTTLTSMSSDLTVGVNTTLYAMYVPAASGELLLSHTRYTGTGAGGGSGIFWITATVTHKDGSTSTVEYAENSLVIPKISETDTYVEFTLKTYSYANSTFNYFYIPNGTGLTQYMASNNQTGFVSTDDNLAKLTLKIPVKQYIFVDGEQKIKNISFYSDLSLPVVKDTITFTHALYPNAPKDSNDPVADGGTGTPLIQVEITDDDGNSIFNSGTGANSKVTLTSSEITEILKSLSNGDNVNYTVTVTISSKNADTMREVYRSDYDHNATTDDPYNYIAIGNDSKWTANVDEMSENKVVYTYRFNDLFTYDSDGFRYNVNNIYFYSDHVADQINVTFKYYDRNIVNGKATSINTNYSSFTVGVPAQNYRGVDGANANLVALVDDALADRNIDNIVDTYKYWATQTEAVKGIQNFVNLKTGNKYTALTYHTDCYGNEGKDSEQWVTYYDENGSVISEEAAYGERFDDIASVTVWFYNTLKEYTVDTHSLDMVNPTADGYFVGTGATTKHTAYYNQRIGTASTDESSDTADIDASTEYLREIFGEDYKGYTETTANAETEYTLGDKTYKFLYWSLDADGKNIISSSRNYSFRITKDLELYPVYGIVEDDSPKLTVTANAKDEYVDSNGIQRTRLNTVMNPYNCPDDDTSIEKVSVIYVKLGDGVEASSIDMEAMRTAIKEALASCTGGTSTLYQVDVTVETTTYDTYEYVYEVTEGDLTNKNRVQFTNSFKTSSLESGSYSNMLVFAAMYYNFADGVESEQLTDGWIVSDNCIYYKNGKETTIE